MPTEKKFKPYKLFQVSSCSRQSFFSFKEEKKHSVYLRKGGLMKGCRGLTGIPEQELWRSPHTAWAPICLLGRTDCAFLHTEAWPIRSSAQEGMARHTSPHFPVPFLHHSIYISSVSTDSVPSFQLLARRLMERAPLC